ncbi:methyl-accepting chemotaxis protein [Paenibacillus rigui]|uniref:Methyl-accepting chemotaxis protein n=1 Tax=Paenibacillus rigui TaxID=554312 RepID=A0A229UGY7_9BACL|nr:methyl-accepting chemotaxis protein [Paenibacillus rigui]OXM82654.1 hypothetical protein CF651_29815 [Paenibacillus rigui]
MGNTRNRFLETLFILGSVRQTAGRIVLSTLFIITLCVAVISYMFYVPSSQEVQKLSEAGLKQTAVLLANEVDANLKEKQAMLKVIAEQGSELGTDKPKHLELLTKFQKAHPEYDNIVYSPDLVGATAFSSNGSPVNVADRDYIKKVREGSVTISDPLISKLNNMMVVVIAIPLMKEGKPYGFYAASYSIEQMAQKVDSVHFGDTGAAFMSMRDGTFLSYPDTSYVLKKKLSDLGSPELNQALADVANGTNHMFTYVENGNKKIGYMGVTEASWVITVFSSEEEIMRPINSLLHLILKVGGGMVIIALMINILIALRIVYPIRKLTNGIDLLAKGDLTHRIPAKGNNDISQALLAFNVAGEQMQRLMLEAKDLSEQVAESADQLASGAEQGAQAAQSISEAIQVMAESSERQMYNIQEGSLASESIAAQIDDVAGHTATVASLAAEASGLSDQGAASMEQLAGKMSEMGKGIGELSSTIGTLSKLSEQIGNIVDVIGGIARQTNILSLNASIEASRSGEAGRGFAVVAEEIRKLAGQSMESAEKIAGFIESIQFETERTLRASEVTVIQASEGQQAGETAGELFARIRSSIQQVAQSIHGVSDAADEIVSGTSTLVSSIRLISESANEAAAESQNVSAAAEEQMASMEEVASSSAELANMAKKLRTQIEQFKL